VLTLALLAACTISKDCVSQMRQADCSSLDAGSIDCDLWQLGAVALAGAS